MKKIIIGTILTSMTLSAQESKKNDLELAPYVGIAAANYYGEIPGTNKNLFSPTFGLNTYFYINNRWSFKMGIEQQIMGAETYFFDDSTSTNQSLKEKLRFISIPFHANLHFGSNKNWMFNIGPTFSFLKTVSLNGVEVGVEGIRTDHIGVGFGIAYRFKITENFSLAIDHQEYIGFTNNFYHKIFGTQPPFVGNIYGSFSLKFIYNIESKSNHIEINKD